MATSTIFSSAASSPVPTILSVTSPTPFTQPDSCTSYWYQSDSLSTVVSDELYPNWSYCQTWGASGSPFTDDYYYSWKTYDRFATLSPAGCPAGWTMAWNSTIRVLTTVAFCCSE